MKRKRYYAQWTSTDSFPWVEPREAWQVFDNELTAPSGAPLAICICLTRSQAFRIRDDMNIAEAMKL